MMVFSVGLSPKNIVVVQRSTISNNLFTTKLIL